MPSFKEKAIIVLQNGALTIGEISHAIRMKWGREPSAHSLLRILNDERFRHLDGDRYTLEENLEDIKESTPAEEPIGLFSLPDLSTKDFVIVDVETTGLDFSKDRVFQVAGIRFSQGQPQYAFNRYISPAPEEIPPDLRRKLGISDHPELEKLIAEAPPPEEVFPFLQQELDDLPWVAHNARFDRGFLEKMGFKPAFHVDTIELAALIFPTASSLTEAEVAPLLNIDPQVNTDLEIHGPKVYGTYHNALTDVLVLSQIYTQLLQALDPFLWGVIQEYRNSGSLFNLESWSAWLSKTESDSMPHVFDPPIQDALETLHRYLKANNRQPRSPQDHMLHHIQDALSVGESCAIEAPTGTGKTLAYIFPALQYALQKGKKACISTATRNLQDQLAEELEKIEAWGESPLCSVVLKGSGNYLCFHRLKSRLGELLSQKQVGEEDLLSALFWLAFAKNTANGLLEEMPRVLLHWYPLLAGWREEIQAGGSCHSQDPNHPHCYRALLYARAEQANLIVMNHALWLSGRGGLDMEKFAVLVTDEAHELESFATSCHEGEITGWALRRLLQRLFTPRLNTGLLMIISRKTNMDMNPVLGMVRALLTRDLPHLAKVFRDFCRRQRLAEDPRYGSRLEIPPYPQHHLGSRWNDVLRAWSEISNTQLLPLLEKLGALLSQPLPQGVNKALEGIRDMLQDQIDLFETALSPNNRRFVHILSLAPQTGKEEKDAFSWSLKCTPVDVSCYLKDELGQIPVILTSATLETGGDQMKYSLDRIGLEFIPLHRRHRLPPALPYQEQAAFAIARGMTFIPLQHTIKSFTQELAQTYAFLLGLTKGRALLLFNSRERMEKVVLVLREKLENIPLLVQGDDRPHRLLEQFRTDIHSVLAGLRQFWQGVDVSGEALSLVFMEKLPFPMFQDPLVVARSKLVERQGGQSFQDYLLPGMLISFKQGFGRLIRSQDDHGAVILFDRRIATKSYLPRLLKSLPGYQRSLASERHWPQLLDFLNQVTPDLVQIPDTWPQWLADIQSPCPSITLPLEGQDPRINDALKAFGFKTFRNPEQARLTELQLQHQDVLGLMPTGSGKSLTFQLPAMVGQGLTLVISPLIALMRDQIEHLLALGFENTAAIYSGQTSDERMDTLNRIQNDQLKLLYISPERLRDPVLMTVLGQANLRALVIDEAHCVYAWGPHFRPEFLYIQELFSHTGRLPITAVTATAPPKHRLKIFQALGLDPHQTPQVIASFARPELRLVVYGPQSRFNTIKGPNDKLKALLKILAAARKNGDTTLVYVNTTTQAENIASQLQLAGFSARAYHGKLPTEVRHDVQDLFLEDHIRIVVCTKAFGMGVDKSGIRYVIHYDIPGDLVAYAQEVGRAGRNLQAGSEAWCILLYYPRDGKIHRFFAQGRLPDRQLMEWLVTDIRAQAQGTSWLDYDLETTLQRLEEDIEDIQIRVSLHRLAELGFLNRHLDTIVSAVIFRLDESQSTDPLISALLGVLPLERSEIESEPIDLLALSQQLQLPLSELNQILVQLALTGRIGFLPLRRLLSLELLPPLLAGHMPQIPHENQLTEEALTDWHDMQAWAKMDTGCRTMALLRYLGEPGVLEPCGTCDLCAPNQKYPWGDITDIEVPKPIDHIETAGLLLEAIDWNQRRQASGEGNILGCHKLWATLSANEYYLRKYGGYEPLRKTPFYGMFRSFPSRMRGISQLFEKLVKKQICYQETHSFTQNKQTMSYSYPALTEKGAELLKSGEYINLEETIDEGI